MFALFQPLRTGGRGARGVSSSPATGAAPPCCVVAVLLLVGCGGNGFLRDDIAPDAFADYRWGYALHWDDPRQNGGGGNAFDDGHTTYVMLPQGVTVLGVWRRHADRITPAPFSRGSPYLMVEGVASSGSWVLNTSRGAVHVTPHTTPAAASTRTRPRPPAVAPAVVGAAIATVVAPGTAAAAPAPGTTGRLAKAPSPTALAKAQGHWSRHRLAFGDGHSALGVSARRRLLALIPEARRAQLLLLRGMTAAAGGDAAHERALAEARAGAVRRALQAAGVSAPQIRLLPWERGVHDNAVELHLLHGGGGAPTAHNFNPLQPYDAPL